MAPLAAQSAATPPTARAIAEPDLLCPASFFARSMMLTTPCGATEPTKCSSESKTPLPRSPSRPISRMTVGRNRARRRTRPAGRDPRSRPRRTVSRRASRPQATRTRWAVWHRAVRVCEWLQSSRSTRENGPNFAFVVRSRLRRASNLMVAPIPPAAKKPARVLRPPRGEGASEVSRRRLLHERDRREGSPPRRPAARVRSRCRYGPVWRSPVRSGHRASTPPWSILPPRLPAPAPAGWPC